MSITLDVACTEQHFEQILQLQQQNWLGAISQSQQVNEGFVFAKHTVPLLQKMSTYLPQVIALDGGKVIGYNLAMLASMREELPILIPMFDEFEKARYKGSPLKERKYFVGGQVCVDKAYRGQGLLKKLYHATRDRLADDYELCVTEIAVNNAISLKAHAKMGFEVIGDYHDGATHWNVVAWPLS